jgi:hypothetical protein
MDNTTLLVCLIIIIFLAWIGASKFRLGMFYLIGMGVPLVAFWLYSFVTGLKRLFYNDDPMGLLSLGMCYIIGLPIWEVLKDTFRKK